MAKRRLMLTYPPELLSEPIIYNLSQQFKLVTNIRLADLTEERGWLTLDIEGEEEDIENGVSWAISKGMRVDIIEES